LDHWAQTLPLNLHFLLVTYIKLLSTASDAVTLHADKPTPEMIHQQMANGLSDYYIPPITFGLWG